MCHLPEAAKKAAIEKLEEYGRRIVRGNRASVHVEKFELEDNHRLKADLAIRHRDVRRIEGRDIIIYDVTNHIRLNTDIINSNPGDARLCMDLPSIVGGGEVCVDVMEVVRMVADGLQ